MNSYEAKLEAKRERYEKKAEQLREEAERLHEHAHQMADVIPFGQPILVGHHSEGRDRRYRERIHNTFGKAFARWTRLATTSGKPPPWALAAFLAMTRRRRQAQRKTGIVEAQP